MSPANDSSVCPHPMGWEAADAAGGPQGGGPLSGAGTLHQPGGELGRKALDACRYSGMEGLTDVIKDYPDGYNVRAKWSGAGILTFGQVKNGILRAMPGLSDEKRRRSQRPPNFARPRTPTPP